MKVEIIKVDQLGDFLKFAELRRDLQVRLTWLKERKEKEIEEMKRIVSITKQLKMIKDKNKFKIDDDMRKAFFKYARWD